LVQGELMVATNLFAVYGKPATMSRITLAFMQDTGWYDVDMEAAGFLNWGHSAGCAFVEKTCNDWIAANPNQQYFCTREQYADTVNTMCTFDGLARARCEDAQFADGCGMKVCGRQAAMYVGQRAAVVRSKWAAGQNGCRPAMHLPQTRSSVHCHAYADWFCCHVYCTQVALGTSPNCLSRQYQAAAGDKFGWQNGLTSRCVPVTWLFNTYAYQFPDSTYKDGWRDSMCYKSTCSAEGTLQLDILGTKVNCPSGQMVDLSKVRDHCFCYCSACSQQTVGCWRRRQSAESEGFLSAAVHLSRWSTEKLVLLCPQVMPNSFQKGMVGPCPDNARICNTLSCNESCTVGGTCVEGRCFCNLQYTGPECAKKLTPSGNYTTYIPVADDGSSAFSGYDSGYLMVS
jgi:hypothetical protein